MVCIADGDVTVSNSRGKKTKRFLIQSSVAQGESGIFRALIKNGKGTPHAAHTLM